MTLHSVSDVDDLGRDLRAGHGLVYDARNLAIAWLSVAIASGVKLGAGR